MKRLVGIPIFTITLLLLGLTFSENAFASIITDPTAGSGGGACHCDQYLNGCSMPLCGRNGSRGGGAAFFIVKSNTASEAGVYNSSYRTWITSSLYRSGCGSGYYIKFTYAGPGRRWPNSYNGALGLMGVVNAGGDYVYNSYGAYNFNQVSEWIRTASNGSSVKLTYEAAQEIYRREGGRNWSEIINRNRWFCSNTSAFSNDTYYQSRSTVRIKNSSSGNWQQQATSPWSAANDQRASLSNFYATDDSGRVDINFSHDMKRTDNENVNSNPAWYTWSHGATGWTQSPTFSRGQTKNVRSTTYSFTLSPGETKTVCQGLTHDRKIVVNGSGQRLDSGGGPYWTSSACATVYRPYKTAFQSRSLLQAKPANTSSVQKTVGWTNWDSSLSDSYYASSDTTNLAFQHQMRRTDTYNIPSRAYWYLGDSWSSGWNNTYFANRSTVPTVNSNDHNVNTDKGTNTTYCQSLVHDRYVRVNGSGSRIPGDSSSRTSSRICINLLHPWNYRLDNMEAKVGDSYIGEQATSKSQYNIVKANNDYALAKPDNNLLKPALVTFILDYNKAESSRSRIWSNAGSGTVNNGSINSSNLCNSYLSKLGISSNSCKVKEPASNNTTDTITIPDDQSFVGGVVCSVLFVTTIEQNLTYGNSAFGDVYWDHSAISCRKIYKKPSAAIINGSIYAAGAISGKAAKKTDGYTYTSWSEYLVVSKGKNNDFASGSTLSNGIDSGVYNIPPTNGNPWANAPLTIRNSHGTSFGHSEISASNSFSNYLRNRCTEIPNCEVVSGNYDISSNIARDSVNPKIIVAKNINIAPSVSEINAILIASNTLDTCSTADQGGNLVAGGCTNPLRINGLVFASKIKLDRTYGAFGGSREASATPAETFNLDPSLFAWSQGITATDPNTNLTETYLRELAPRQ